MYMSSLPTCMSMSCMYGGLMEETYTLVLGMQTAVSCRLELRISGRGTNVLNY